MVGVVFLSSEPAFSAKGKVITMFSIGSEHLQKRHKKGIRVLSLIMGGCRLLDERTGSRRKMFITKANAAS